MCSLFVPSSLSILIYVCVGVPQSPSLNSFCCHTEVTHTSAPTQHHPPTRSLGGRTVSFLKALPSQKLFLGEVTHTSAPTQHHPPSRSLEGRTVSFLKALPSQKLFLGEVTHTSAPTQHHPPSRSLGGRTVSFLKALPSQKLFLGEVSHNLPPQPVIVVVLLMFIMM